MLLANQGLVALRVRREESIGHTGSMKYPEHAGLSRIGTIPDPCELDRELRCEGFRGADDCKAARRDERRKAASDVGNCAEISLGDRSIGVGGSGDVDKPSSASTAGSPPARASSSMGASSFTGSFSSSSSESSSAESSWGGFIAVIVNPAGRAGRFAEDREGEREFAGKYDDRAGDSLFSTSLLSTAGAMDVILRSPPDSPPDNEALREFDVEGRSESLGGPSPSSLLIFSPESALFRRPRAASPNEGARDREAGVGGES